MTATTQTVQNQAVMIVESDIPADLTIAQYRARRPTVGRVRRRRALAIRRHRSAR
jgi:hypothetical protein